jgi:hypothetical protein
MRHQAGVLSITTWQQQVGLDPAHEAANFEAEAGRKAEGAGDEARKGERHREAKKFCVSDSEVSEVRKKGSKGYTGREWDKNHHQRCYGDGKEVRCERPGAATNQTKAGDATPTGTGLASPSAITSGGSADGSPDGTGGGKTPPSAPADPNRVLTPADRKPRRLRPRKYGPEAGEIPPPNWGKLILAQTGQKPPPGMTRPHGHHIILKKGRGSQVRWVERAKNILEFYNIPWFRGTGPEGNLVYAPNVAGQHTTRAAKKLYKELRDVHRLNVEEGLTWQQGRKQITARLQDAGDRMASLEF